MGEPDSLNYLILIVCLYSAVVGINKKKQKKNFNFHDFYIVYVRCLKTISFLKNYMLKGCVALCWFT